MFYRWFQSLYQTYTLLWWPYDFSYLEHGYQHQNRDSSCSRTRAFAYFDGGHFQNCHHNICLAASIFNVGGGLRSKKLGLRLSWGVYSNPIWPMHCMWKDKYLLLCVQKNGNWDSNDRQQLPFNSIHVCGAFIIISGRRYFFTVSISFYFLDITLLKHGVGVRGGGRGVSRKVILVQGLIYMYFEIINTSWKK